MKAYVLIKTRVGETVDVVRALRKLPGVVSADVTFGPYDAVAVVSADALDAIGDLVTGTIHSTPGVIETLTCLVVDVA
jgi:DNA-binding Lrp family transcriptional regulator